MATSPKDPSPQTDEQAPSPMFLSPSILGLSDTDQLPSTVLEFQKFRFHQMQAQKLPFQFIGFITQRLVRNHSELEVEFPGAQQAVFNIILAINLLQQSKSFSPSDADKIQSRFILETIMGDNPNARGPYAFPISLQSDASTIRETVNQRLPTMEVITPEVSGSGNGLTSTSQTLAPKKRRTNKQPQPPLPSISSQSVKNVLRGIVDLGTCRRSYRLANKDSARDCNVVGNNGISIGTWWPYRICALRDGAHGATMAGIAGSVSDGAYSIIVSGMYADLDKDNGDLLYYSGSKAHDNCDPNNPILTPSTRALQTSKREDRSVRVLRAAGGDSRFAPSVGIRFDGLYKVVEELLPRNHNGGRYVRFTLVRNPGQPAIDLSRPNAEERAIFDRLKEF